MKKTLLIMAGGTGGHIFPALAVARLLHDKGVHIEWLGTTKGMEARLVPEYHYTLNTIDIGGLRGKGLMTVLLLPFKVSRALLQTIKIYIKLKPDVVLGMGGFVSGPGGVAAWLLGKPLVLHEQNAIAGLTNKLLFTLATKVYAAFPGAFAAHKKLMVIGNPVRKEITQTELPEQRLKNKWVQTSGKTLNILLIGGSLGAAALNEVVPQALLLLTQGDALANSAFDKITIRHQCGAKQVQKTEEYYQDLLKKDELIKVEIMPFIDNMADNYTWADLLICRSGALTISEIAAVGIAAILVPFPYAVDDHQTANAAYLVDNNAAFLIQQNDLNAADLAQLLMTLTQDQLLNMAKNARQQAIDSSLENAAETIAEQCLQLAG